jgi:predicted N-acyltransferase
MQVLTEAPPTALAGADMRFPVTGGEARIERSASAFSEDEWREAFAGEAKDGRYHAIVQATIRGDFAYRYLAVRDRRGRLRVLQPVFLTNQDVLVGVPAWVRSAAAAMRRSFPRFLMQRMLMAGCAAGEGHPGLIGNHRESAAMLFEALDTYGRRVRATMVTLKDFPMSNRARLDAGAAAAGYARIPSFPGTAVDLTGYLDFDDYLSRAVGKATRKSLRRKFRAADTLGPPISFEVVSDPSNEAEALCELYRQVYERSEFRFEELTPDYFREIGRQMSESARFFVWRVAGRPVAVSATLVLDGKIYDNYIGLDHAVAAERHLYFVTLRDVFNWAIQNGITTYYSTPLDYEPKLRMRFRLAPLDLYVKHLNPAINPVFRRILPLLEPTRYDKILPKFSNSADLK